MAKTKPQVITVLRTEGIQFDLCYGKYLWFGCADGASDRQVWTHPLVVDTPDGLKKLIKAAQTALKASREGQPK